MSLITETELQDWCIGVQLETKLDDKAWKKKFGNEGGLYGFIKDYGNQERIHYERSGMAFVHATVIELTDDKKLLEKLDKIVQEKLSELKQPRERK